MMPHMAARYRTVSLQDIDEVSAVGGTLRWKPVRRTLGIRAFGTNAYAADAGQDVVEEHDEQTPGAGGHEEMYVVLTGHARFTVDGDEIDAPAGTIVFLPEPAARRAAKALEDGTTVLAVGAEPGRPYEVSAWEWNFLAEDQKARGDLDGAIATMRDALGEHDGNPSVHYNLACYLARAGQVDEAREQLAHATEADAEKVRRWAQGDTDLDPLRDAEGRLPGVVAT
jgi:tetratricopeptide (TPR) repeat protein